MQDVSGNVGDIEMDAAGAAPPPAPPANGMLARGKAMVSFMTSNDQRARMARGIVGATSAALAVGVGCLAIAETLQSSASPGSGASPGGVPGQAISGPGLGPGNGTYPGSVDSAPLASHDVMELILAGMLIARSLISGAISVGQTIDGAARRSGREGLGVYTRHSGAYPRTAETQINAIGLAFGALGMISTTATHGVERDAYSREQQASLAFTAMSLVWSLGKCVNAYRPPPPHPADPLAAGHGLAPRQAEEFAPIVPQGLALHPPMPPGQDTARAEHGLSCQDLVSVGSPASPPPNGAGSQQYPNRRPSATFSVHSMGSGAGA